MDNSESKRVTYLRESTSNLSRESHSHSTETTLPFPYIPGVRGAGMISPPVTWWIRPLASCSSNSYEYETEKRETGRISTLGGGGGAGDVRARLAVGAGS